MSEQGSGPRKGGTVMGAVAGLVVVLIGLMIWSQGAQVPGPEGKTEPEGETGVAGNAPAEAVIEAVTEPTALPTPAPAEAPPAEAAAPEVGSAEAPPDVVAPTEVAAPEPAASEPADPDPVLARYDALRVTPEGALTLAGTVAPGALVEVLLDGAVIDTQTADAQGAFASVVTVAPSAAPRGLGLRVRGADGVARMADETLTVAPSPLALAEAEKIAAAEALAARPLVTDATGGARLLAEATAELVIDTLAFGEAGAMSVSGRGAPAGAALRAYVDNAEVGLTRPDASGAWQMRLPAAAPGAHSLRVDALDAAGEVLARAEQGFETVLPAAEIAARLPALPPASAELSTTPPAVPLADASPRTGTTTGAGGRAITILRGHTLWAIAREAYGNPYLYVQIFEANRDQIRDPDLIYPGQVFTLPR